MSDSTHTPLVTADASGAVSAMGANAPSEPPPAVPLSALELMRHRVHRFFHRHGHRLWWMHSAYALVLGASVVFFARKGYDHARWLAVSVGLAWLLVVFFFRVFGSGTREQSYATAASTGKLRFLVMTYVLKNLYQGMLFFLLPFYWQSATVASVQSWFLALLAACALLSTMDVVFDRIVMRWRVLASLFHAFILFGTLGLILPAFLPQARTLVTLCAAAGVSAAAFWTLHVPVTAFRSRAFVAVFLASIGAASGGAMLVRRAIPPVPMYLAHGAVGPSVLRDGRLALEAQRLNQSMLPQLVAVTEVMAPAGHGDRLSHVWRRNGVEVFRARGLHAERNGRSGWLRLRSELPPEAIPNVASGAWSVDIDTEDGQLVGRVRFAVDE